MFIHKSKAKKTHLIQIALLISTQKLSKALSMVLAKESHEPGTYWVTGQEA